MGFKSIIKVFFIICYTSTSQYSFSQSKHDLVFISNQQKIVDEFAKPILLKKSNLSFNKSIAAESLIQQLLFNGFAEAAIDSNVCIDSVSYFWVHVGKKYKIKSISLNRDTNISFLNQNFDIKSLQYQIFNSENLNKYLEQAVTICENNGYPFVKVNFTSLLIEGETFSADLNCILGDLVTIDSIENTGNLKISPFILEQFLGINKGSHYKQASIDNIDKRLKKIDFAVLTKKTEINFDNNRAQISTFLNKKDVNIFDGIIGFSSDENNKGKLKLNGNLHLKLKNALHQAETIEFEWMQSSQKSQRIKLFTMAPWLLKSIFGLSYSLDFEKQDTNYIHLIHTPGIIFNWSVSNYIKPYAFIETNRNLSFSSNQNTDKQFNYNSLLYAIELDLLFYDDPFLPQNGFGIKFNGAIGTKSIIKTPAQESSLFDSINLKSTKSRLSLDAEYYHQFFNRPVLKIGAKLGHTYDENITRSELFKLGGNKSFRGFDEESIEASSFVIIDLEARFPIERYSYLFAFYDIAYIENQLQKNARFDNPFSIGAGISLETEVGIFSIAYSLGSRYNQAINLKSSKIHIGYTARF